MYVTEKAMARPRYTAGMMAAWTSRAPPEADVKLAPSSAV